MDPAPDLAINDDVSIDESQSSLSVTGRSRRRSFANVARSLTSWLRKTARGGFPTESVEDNATSQDTAGTSNTPTTMKPDTDESATPNEPADPFEALIANLTISLRVFVHTGDHEYVKMMRGQSICFGQQSGIDVVMPDLEVDRILDLLFHGKDPLHELEVRAETNRLNRYWPGKKAIEFDGKALFELSQQARDFNFPYVDKRMRRQIVVQWCRRYATCNPSQDFGAVLHEIRDIFVSDRENVGPDETSLPPYDGRMEDIVRRIKNADDPGCQLSFLEGMLRAICYKLESNLKPLEVTQVKVLSQNNLAVGLSTQLSDGLQATDNAARLVDFGEMRNKISEMRARERFGVAVHAGNAISCIKNLHHVCKMVLRDLALGVAVKDRESHAEPEHEEDETEHATENATKNVEEGVIMGFNINTSMLADELDRSDESSSEGMADFLDDEDALSEYSDDMSWTRGLQESANEDDASSSDQSSDHEEAEGEEEEDIEEEEEEEGEEGAGEEEE
ncbi:hypothetical protein LEL_00229 [Akanthomyces lecanii RCEF 1005]|uniref:Uncharacterized protein n=1 Tax=Akanthomyces lecanii RCEF 1005 TaxID=1081108 RepID=A0A168JP11_CORDF|nr:hypothetical protein LEL_00229 [Akanthomyces lecanii RCEF 1005]